MFEGKKRKNLSKVKGKKKKKKKKTRAHTSNDFYEYQSAPIGRAPCLDAERKNPPCVDGPQKKNKSEEK